MESGPKLCYRDDAIIGEAAGLAMGLVMMGTNDLSAIEEMARYATETQHEKIIRGLSTGIAMITYSRLEEADQLIDNLMKDKGKFLNASFYDST